jgi:hypothetical protein
MNVVGVASLFPVNVPLGFNQNGIFGRLEPTVLLLPLRIQYVPTAALVNLYLSPVAGMLNLRRPRFECAAAALPTQCPLSPCDATPSTQKEGLLRERAEERKKKNRISGGGIYYQRG